MTAYCHTSAELQSRPRGLRFRSRIRITGINPYVLIDARQVSRLKENWRKPMPVRVQINGNPRVPWRICLMPRGGGAFYLYLAEALRRASGTQVGDRVSVRVQFDTEYRAGPMHRLPSWFSHCLERNRSASSRWKELSPSVQKDILRYFARLKSPEARARNARRALCVLEGIEGRFLGRDWNTAEDSGGRDRHAENV